MQKRIVFVLLVLLLVSSCKKKEPVTSRLPTGEEEVMPSDSRLLPDTNELSIQQVYRGYWYKGAEVEALLGEPDDKMSYWNDAELHEIYFYGEDQFLFINGFLNAFSVKSSKFRLLNKVQVGMKTSEMQSLLNSYGRVELLKNEGGREYWAYFHLNAESGVQSKHPVQFYFEDDGVISLIHFFVMEEK